MSSTSHKPHITPLPIYLGIGAALLVLTGITVLSAQLDFGKLIGMPHLNILLAMAIATFKATLVALFFMHLLYDKKIYLTVFLVSLLCLGIFITLTLFDTLRRAEPYELEAHPVRSQAQMYEGRSSAPTTPAHRH